MGLGSNIKNKLGQYLRVISVSKKPDREEFWSSAKICGAGILAIGFIGFVIYVLFRLV
ncbi:MAG: protein translocase SEC61 complex subunit gamma [Candidatus Aenigmarchaeota archaeon]|nr:protein translocase SEC61 complex subunit gamma [Candidatus Aenigmarchaeota archaeon]